MVLIAAIECDRGYLGETGEGRRFGEKYLV
jgi:hypothetical protein